MLFFLPYIYHDTEKLHLLVDYFFRKVFDNFPKFYTRNELLPKWYLNSDNTLRGLETNFKKFIEQIPLDDQLNIVNSFMLSNNVEYLFANKTDHYSNLLHISTSSDYPAYQTYLDDIFVNLYDNQLSTKNSTFIKLISGLTFYDHYNSFFKNAILSKGTFSVCPYCGIENLRMVKSEGRPDYDHLLPKGNSLYVFSAVNLRNLFPSGATCNKLKDDSQMLYTDIARNFRTIAFYPYSNSPDPYTLINFDLQCVHYPDSQSGGTWDVVLTPIDIKDGDLNDKIDTWNRVFHIKKRYSEYISLKCTVLIKSIINKISYSDTEQVAMSLINSKLVDELNLEYELVSNIEGLLPKRMFYQWLLSEKKYLSSMVAARLISLMPTNTLLDVNSPDFE